jgi:hypothetical protein
VSELEVLLPPTVGVLPLLLAAIVTFLSACVQGTLGFGFAVVSVPVLSLIHPALVPVPQLLLALPLTLSMAFRERRSIDFSGLGFVVGGRVVGVSVGLSVIEVATPSTLDALIGGLVLLAALMLSTRVPLQKNRVSECAFGALSGFSSYVSAIGGPPLALLYRNETGAVLRASLALQFALGLVLSVSARAASGQMTMTDVQVALWLLVPLALGVRTSHALTHRVDPRVLRISVLGLSALSGALLLLRASLD